MKLNIVWEDIKIEYINCALTCSKSLTLEEIAKVEGDYDVNRVCDRYRNVGGCNSTKSNAHPTSIGLCKYSLKIKDILYCMVRV